MGNRKNNQPINRRERTLTPERIEIFLADLAEHGIVNQAARAASPGASEKYGAASSFKTLRRKDAVFAARWDAALEEADAKLLREAHRRAVEGTSRAQYFKGQRIKDVNPETGEIEPVSEKEFSDRLLELLLKARFPRLFIERKAIEHHQAPGGWVITAEDLACLDERETEQLQSIMAKVMAARGEIPADEGMDDAAMVDITPDAEGDADEPDDMDRALIEWSEME